MKETGSSLGQAVGKRWSQSSRCCIWIRSSAKTPVTVYRLAWSWLLAKDWRFAYVPAESVTLIDVYCFQLLKPHPCHPQMAQSPLQALQDWHHTPCWWLKNEDLPLPILVRTQAHLTIAIWPQEVVLGSVFQDVQSSVYILTSMSETMVAMHAVKLLTFQPMINPVLRCREHKCAGHNVFEIAAEEFMIH